MGHVKMSFKGEHIITNHHLKIVGESLDGHVVQAEQTIEVDTIRALELRLVRRLELFLWGR